MSSSFVYKCSGYFLSHQVSASLDFCLFLFVVTVLVFLKVIVKHLIPQVGYRILSEEVNGNEAQNTRLGFCFSKQMQERPKYPILVVVLHQASNGWSLTCFSFRRSTELPVEQKYLFSKDIGIPTIPGH